MYYTGDKSKVEPLHDSSSKVGRPRLCILTIVTEIFISVVGEQSHRIGHLKPVFHINKINQHFKTVYSATE